MEWRRGLRIVTERARHGFHHPVNRAQVLAILKAVGPVACYGLRTIEFARQPRGAKSNVPVFGRYKVPGRIILFEQPLSPWRLPGLLEGDNISRFERAGALIKPLVGSQATLVEWPEGTLPRFMLEEVLLHELGHHVLQHEKGKRLVRIARTQDHEAFAARFAMRQRLMLRARGG